MANWLIYSRDNFPLIQIYSYNITIFVGMELEDKSIRLETMGGKEPYSLEEPRVLSIMNHAKNSLTSSFKYSQRNKIKTEPSESSLRTSNHQEKPQRDSNFS